MRGKVLIMLNNDPDWDAALFAGTTRLYYVVIAAHHDHFGIGEPDARGDSIYNGALDNGAGVVQVLAIARALTALPSPPRRSVLALFVAAEEQGLLGSRFLQSIHLSPPEGSRPT